MKYQIKGWDALDSRTEGWTDADEAITHSLPGYTSFSQGTTPWDEGWNARLEQEQKKRTYLSGVFNILKGRGQNDVKR